MYQNCENSQYIYRTDKNSIGNFQPKWTHVMFQNCENRTYNETLSMDIFHGHFPRTLFTDTFHVHFSQTIFTDTFRWHLPRTLFTDNCHGHFPRIHFQLLQTLFLTKKMSVRKKVSVRFCSEKNVHGWLIFKTMKIAYIRKNTELRNFHK